MVGMQPAKTGQVGSTLPGGGDSGSYRPGPVTCGPLRWVLRPQATATKSGSVDKIVKGRPKTNYDRAGRGLVRPAHGGPKPLRFNQRVMMMCWRAAHHVVM